MRQSDFDSTIRRFESSRPSQIHEQDQEALPRNSANAENKARITDAQKPAQPHEPLLADGEEAVRVTACDCNLALGWDKMFDGFPFSANPKWIGWALTGGLLLPHTRGSTDYAQWDVVTPAGTVNAWPGDWIVYDKTAALRVIKVSGRP